MEVLYIFLSSFYHQGTAVCEARIFLWDSCDKLVISDIDGTITKSDVLGHVLPAIGRDWSQQGVTGLFNKIRRNGYRFVYLSARAIGQVSCFNCPSHTRLTRSHQQ